MVRPVGAEVEIDESSAVATDVVKTVIASFAAVPGREDDLERLLQWVARASRSEPGCQQYDLFRAERDGRGSFHLIERWDGVAAIDVHRETDHYKEYRAQVGALIEGDVGVLVLTPVAVARPPAQGGSGNVATIGRRDAAG
jgi:quinol monooxygenase YgiN